MKTSLKSLLIFSFGLILFQSCVSVKPTYPGEELNSSQPTIDSVISKINLPVAINLSSIEKELNTKYPKGTRVYSGSKKTGKNSRISHCRIKVRDNLKVTTNGGKIKAYIPLTVDIRYEWWKWVLGVKYSDYIRFKKLEMNVYIDVTPKFDKKWNFKPSVKSKVRLNKSKGFLSFLINMKLMGMDGKISKDIQKAISKNLDVRNQVKKEWEKFKEPIPILFKPDTTWLLARPHKFNFAPTSSINSKTLQLNFSLESTFETYFGEKPNPRHLGALPPLGNSINTDNSINISLLSRISLETVEKTLNDSILGDYKLENGRTVKVKKIKILGINDNLVLKINFRSKNVKGWMYFIGDMKLNKKEQIIYVDNFRFSATTNKVLLDKAVWLTDQLFSERLGDELQVSVKEDLANYAENVNEEFQDFKIGDNIYVSGNIESLEILGFYISKNNLIIVPNAKAKVEIKTK